MADSPRMHIHQRIVRRLRPPAGGLHPEHGTPAKRERHLAPVRSFAQWPTFSSLFAFLVVAVLAVSCALAGAPRETAALLPFFAVFLALLAISYLLRGRIPRVADFIRHFQHLVLYGAFYAHIHAMMTAAHPYAVDASLARIDAALFGVNPVAWLGQHAHPYLTDALSLAYVSYYFGMPILLVLLWRRHPETDFRTVLSAMTIGWYGALVTYYLFPALGPQRFTPEQLPALAGWLPTTEWIRAFLAANLTPAVRDCVPSMHTGVTLLTLAFAYRFERVYFWMLLPFGAGVILATVYLQQHYVIDVLLGVCAFLFIVAAVRVFRPQ